MWLKHTFTLETTDYCVNYVLHVDAAPAGTVIYLNDQAVGTVSDNLTFNVDITLNVALGENSIVFCVIPGAAGHFAGIELEPVPCD